ncbi:MAG: hypothetical protein HKN69_09320, partial [Desulfofustis sp.]|nr:hypothetical protein [Desulfofustis sp.]
LFRRGLTNLPWLHPEETIYSWYAACHRANGLNHPICTSWALFENPYSIFAHDIPNRLLALQDHGYHLLSDPLSLVARHSVLGFFLPWLSSDRVAIINDHVKYGTPKDVKYHLGLPASRIGALHPFKACVDCIKEDVQTLGYSYWRTTHQFPGVWVCLKHRMLLSQAELARSPRHYHRCFLPPDISHWKSISVDSQAKETLLRLSSLAYDISHMRVGELCTSRLPIVYRQSLTDLSLSTESGQLRIQPAIKCIRKYYTGLHSIPEFRILSSLSQDWAGFIGNIARRQTKPAHPFKHLLLIGLLFSDIREFKNALSQAVYSTEPCPSPPAPVADSRKAIFEKMVIDGKMSLSAAGREVGISGSTAVRWAKLAGINYLKRPKSGKKQGIEKASKLLARGESKQKTSETCRISMTTVTRLLSSDPDLRSRWAAARFQVKRDTSRAAFSAILESNPGVPLRILRKFHATGYNWLYRNDRVWLKCRLELSQ